MLTSSGRGGRAASDCARPASTPSTLARNDQSWVRDARAREATCPPSPTRHGRDARAGGISLAALFRQHRSNSARLAHALLRSLSCSNILIGGLSPSITASVLP